MQHVLKALAAVGFLVAPLAGSAQTAVVVELFTSQGCAVCPPADQILAELKEVEGVVPLAFHVDYWDYIGWKDAFARPEFTDRQGHYAKRLADGLVFTPQMVVNGAQSVLGGDGAAIGGAIRAAQAQAISAEMTAQNVNGHLSVSLSGHVGTPSDLLLVHYTPQAEVEIFGGENMGRVMTYVNIVTGLESLGTWNGHDPLSLDVPLKEAGPAYVILQETGLGRIFAVAAVN